MVKNIYNSSGKITGNIEFFNDKLIINNKNKSQLIINDKDVLNIALTKELNNKIILKLYDDYTLTIGEIASIFDVLYYKVNKIIRNLDTKTNKKSGRRNSSFSKNFSTSRRESISKANKGSKVYNNGIKEIFLKQNEEIPDGYIRGRLPFTQEHKDKIRQAGLDGKFTSPSERARKGWENGKFDNVNFRKGIGGFITSKKINKRFFFRSLLELFFIINYLENDESVINYRYEPFRIICDNGSLYTPDFLINNKIVIELKPYNFIYKQGGSIQEKFEYKKAQAEDYCKNNNLIYKVVFDKDINFKYDVLLHELKDMKYINEFKIKFLEPERVWSKK